jgi:hypothetical protein
MKMREALWSAVACYRFDFASLLAAIRTQRFPASKLAWQERQQAAALQSASRVFQSCSLSFAF